MKLVRIRLSQYAVTLNETTWPIGHEHHDPSIGFSLYVRIRPFNQGGHSYVYGSLIQDGVARYAGRGQLHGYHLGELYRFISTEAFNTADLLEVPSHHVWPLIDQFPDFAEGAVDIEEAKLLERPILDLLERGASPSEVIEALDIKEDLYEFVAGVSLPSRDDDDDPQVSFAQAMEPNPMRSRNRTQ